MAESSTTQAADLRVREGLRFVAANALQSVMASTLGAAILVLVLRDSIVLWPALLWLCALTAVGALRLVLRRAVAELPADAALQRHYLQRFTACALASGLIWASAPWALSTSADRTLQSAVLFACAAIATGGAFASLASRRAAFAIFIPPMLAPVLFGLLDGSTFFLIIGGIALALGAVLMRMLIVLNRQFVEQIQLREQNAGLLRQLRQRTADAEAANEAKSRFLAAAGHDLRQPMHAIALRSQALQEQELPEPVRDIAGRLDQSVAAMQGLFDALLDISRLDAGGAQPSIAAFELRGLFDKLAAAYADSAAEQSVQLHMDAGDLWVASDVLWLERILRQLLDNALRYAAGSPVSVTAHRTGAGVAIEVRDRGKGIAPEQQALVFREFVQLENPQRDRRKGLGLGLAIVERLARALDHRLELESEPGQGSCFRITVPAASPAPAAGGSSRASEREHGVPDLGGLLIALIDDEPDVLDAMHMLLSHWRCDVVAATRSHDLDLRLRERQRLPDLLICDYRLAEPDNGCQVIGKLRRAYGAQIPALLITGDIQAFRAEADATAIVVVSKPVEPLALRRLIAQHTGRHRTP